MPNRIDDGATFLTVAGAAGSETYQCPNTAPYITADTDYIWFKTDASQRTVTTAELIGYDLQRTPVKYDDDAPNAIVAITILNAAVTGTKRDYLFRDMWLPILWDNNLNAYGHIKDNRTGQQLWTPEPIYDAATIALIARLTGSPTVAMQDLIDVTIKSLKAEGGATKYWDRMDVIVFLNLDVVENCLNWKANATNPSMVNSPTFAAKLGVTTNGTDTQYIDTNWKQTTHGVKFTQNDASYIFIKNVTTSKDGYFGCYAATGGLILAADSNNAVAHSRINDNAGTTVGQARITDYICVTRRGASTGNAWVDDVDKLISLPNTLTASVAMVDLNVRIGAINGLSSNVDGRFVFYCFGSSFADKTDLDGFLTIIRNFNTNIGGTF
jgi:hypothetical protein